MGIFTYIKHKAPLKCCGKVVDDWQSKQLTIISNGTVYPVDHRLATMTLKPGMCGEIHTYCADCSQRTEYWFVDGRLDPPKPNEPDSAWYYRVTHRVDVIEVVMDERKEQFWLVLGDRFCGEKIFTSLPITKDQAAQIEKYILVAFANDEG